MWQIRSPVSVLLPGTPPQKASPQEHVVETVLPGPVRRRKTPSMLARSPWNSARARFYPLDKRDIPLYTGTVSPMIGSRILFAQLRFVFRSSSVPFGTHSELLPGSGVLVISEFGIGRAGLPSLQPADSSVAAQFSGGAMNAEWCCHRSVSLSATTFSSDPGHRAESSTFEGNVGSTDSLGRKSSQRDAIIRSGTAGLQGTLLSASVCHVFRSGGGARCACSGRR